MASRRLDISSLLCDDQLPDPVVLAPHLRHSGQSSTPSSSRHPPSPSMSPTFPPSSQMLHSHRPSSSHSSRHHLSPPSDSYSLPPPTISTSHQFPSPISSMAPKLPSFGLEALVQAATEERRRLSGGSSTESDIPRRPSPSIEQRHITQPQQFHHPQSFRQHKPSDDYVRSPLQHHSPVLSPVQAIRSPVQPIRSSPAYSPLLQNQPPSRQRGTERHRVPLEEAQVRLSPVDDLHYRPPQSVFFSSPPQPQPSRQQLDLEHRMQQQQQQHELQRQRHHHEQLLYQEQQQQQLARERQVVYTERPALPPPSHPHRKPSMPLQVDVTALSHYHPPPSHAGGRKSDPGQPHSVVTSVKTDRISSSSPHLPFDPMHVGENPNKKRRYSDSPINSISADEKERLRREREKMVTGDLGYGRPEPAANVGVTGPRRPGSGHGHGRKHLGLVELVTPDREAERIPIPSSSLPAVESGREAHGLLSPHGRRSPPGSQSGRARAARKSEEVEHTLLDLVSQVGSGRARVPEKEERKKPQSRPPAEGATVPEPAPPKTKSRPPPSPLAPSAKASEEDAHEWFLEHFDDYNAPPVTQHPPRAPPALPVTEPLTSSDQCTSGSPVLTKRTPTPSTMPEAAVALEQELEDLVDPPEHVSKIEPDMDIDVDLAVTELVAETLEADDAKVEDGMEVDVEDELLSLVDDRSTIRRPTGKPATLGPSSTKPPVPLRAGLNVARQASPSAMSTVSAPSPVRFLSPAVRSSSTRPTSERGSMPPPAPVAPGRSKDKEDKSTERAGSVSATAPAVKKKKDVLSKPGPKPKANAAVATKPRTKPGPRPKPKQSDMSLPATAAKAKGAAGSKKPATSRSRSTSVMPSGTAGTEGGEMKAEKQEEEESDQEDDKLYCVCKTKYDEDRCMIACDRCDDWYHTQCVNMPDVEVDLVDQFICPPCIERNSHLSLRTTYKRRCLYGLRHPDPSSSKACHRPARGAYSKYCSDECGVKYMQSRADAWAKMGGKKDKLWETVKDAEKREGVVICAEDHNDTKMEVDEACKDEKEKVFKQKQGKIEREVKRLNELLDNVVILREEIKKGMEGVIWREKLLELATERAEQVGECGWDQRLCFGDEEWADFGAGVLESYEEVKMEQGEGGTAEGEGEWWCPGKKTCDRHAGWQTVRYRDVCKEKEKKEDALSNLTTREREIRKRIEDILDPHGRKCNDSSGKSPLKASNAKLSNGHTRGKTNGDTTKKGKKRKALS